MKNFSDDLSFTPVRSKIYPSINNRFILYTPEEEEKMQRLFEYLPTKSIICSPWFTYGRDNKISSILSQIDQIIG